MTQAVTYERETKSVAFQGKIIVLESLTPVLPPKEKAQRKKEIERYTGNCCNNNRRTETISHIVLKNEYRTRATLFRADTRA